MPISAAVPACVVAAVAGSVCLAGPRPVYPEGAEIPRSLTPAEEAYLAEHPLAVPSLRGAPPTTRVRTPAEYDPMEGLLLAWEGSSSWTAILAQIAREVTVTAGGRIWMVVDSTSERNSVQSSLASAGVDLTKVSFVVRTTDTIWIRDYGPRIVYEGVQPDGSGGVRAIVDHTYNRPRPSDNALPSFLATQWGWDRFELPLVHGGGNYHLASGERGLAPSPSFATALIQNENPSLTGSQIVDLWRSFQNVETTLTAAYPASVDSTQHIDMWMQIVGDRAALVSDWPNEPGSVQDQVADQTAAAMQADGWAITRIPAVRSGGTHYTFTNVVMFNDIVLVPQYTNSTAAARNAAAIAAWQAACPDKTIIPINCQAIVTAAGVMHCIVMHVPAAPGGEAPSVAIRGYAEPQTVNPGDVLLFEWATDDDAGTVTYDFDVSFDGGASWDGVVSQQADVGGYYWTAPDVASADTLVRVTVRDADGNTGSDIIDAPITILGTPACPADLNGDGLADFGDVAAFVTAFNAQDGLADQNGDGVIDFGDVAAFADAFSAGC
jgi:agmatine/peptidylarginine deiminase